MVRIHKENNIFISDIKRVVSYSQKLTIVIITIPIIIRACTMITAIMSSLNTPTVTYAAD